IRNSRIRLPSLSPGVSTPKLASLTFRRVCEKANWLGMSDAFDLAGQMCQGLIGIHVEEGSSGGGPSAAVEYEDGRGVPQIADGLDPFHWAALDGLKGDRCRNERQQFARFFVAGQFQ